MNNTYEEVTKVENVERAKTVSAEREVSKRLLAEADDLIEQVGQYMWRRELDIALPMLDRIGELVRAAALIDKNGKLQFQG